MIAKLLVSLKLKDNSVNFWLVYVIIRFNW